MDCFTTSNASGGFVISAVLVALVVGFWARGYWLKKSPASLSKLLAAVKKAGE